MPPGSRPTLAGRVVGPLRRFLAIEAASALLLLAATAAALAWANSPWAESYRRLWQAPFGLSLGGLRLELTLMAWVNEGLMVLFFFLAGMEIKHELVHGELSSRERALLPLLGALGGMLAPALLYLAFHARGPAAAGWGVPMATDIAFAVAALALLGRRVPAGLEVFLLALAIVDDLGAVLVIALGYSHGFSWLGLSVAAGALVLVVALQWAGVRLIAVYGVVGLVVWLGMLDSGVHPTVAGVLLGLLTPTRPLSERRRSGSPEPPATRGARRSPQERLSAALHPWSAFIVMPLFALANAGVPIEAGVLADPLALRVSLGVGLGLLVGKPLGVGLACWLAVRLGLAALPRGVGWGSLVGAGMLAGIGFTMSLFVTTLAFQDAGLAAASKLGVMVASLCASGIGLATLRRTLAPAPTAG